MEPAYVYLDGNITEIEGWQCTGCGSYLINTNKQGGAPRLVRPRSFQHENMKIVYV